jgi:hypothetical protein
VVPDANSPFPKILITALANTSAKVSSKDRSELHRFSTFEELSLSYALCCVMRIIGRIERHGAHLGFNLAKAEKSAR